MRLNPRLRQLGSSARLRREAVKVRALELDPGCARAWHIGKSAWRDRNGLGTVNGWDRHGGVGVAYDKKQCYLRALELDPGYARAWSN